MNITAVPWWSANENYNNSIMVNEWKSLSLRENGANPLWFMNGNFTNLSWKMHKFCHV